MKKVLLIIGTAMMMVACGTKEVKENTIAEQLADRLLTLRQNGYMMGHQDAPMYGVTWDGTYRGDSAELGRCDVLATVGDYPAVMGFDLGGIELGDTKNLDSVPFTRIHDELIAHHERGGIVTVSWHPRNPLTTAARGGLDGQKFPEGSAWDVADTTVVASILPGGSQFEKFQSWMPGPSTYLRSAFCFFRKSLILWLGSRRKSSVPQQIYICGIGVPPAFSFFTSTSGLTSRSAAVERSPKHSL